MLAGAIGFVSARDHTTQADYATSLGAHEVYAMAPSGMMQSRLTNVSTRNVNPVAVSPDGQQMLIAGENEQNGLLLDPQGTMLQQYSHPGRAAYPLS